APARAPTRRRGRGPRAPRERAPGVRGRLRTRAARIRERRRPPRVRRSLHAVHAHDARAAGSRACRLARRTLPSPTADLPRDAWALLGCVLGRSPHVAGDGVPGTAGTPEARMSVIEGRTLAADVDRGCDVCIVGSGAGGSVLAAGLCARGLDVVMVEEGPYRTSKDFDLEERHAY